jgi:hypothetical protein
LQPVQPYPFRHLGETVPRQVDYAALGRHLEEIDQLRAPRRSADACQAAALGDGIDGGRLAGIRAARKRDFSARVRGELMRLGRTGQKFNIGIGRKASRGRPNSDRP